MKSIVKIITTVTLLYNCGVKAQEIVKKDTIKGTEMTMTMDKRVDGMIENMENSCSRKIGEGDNSEINTPKIKVPSRPQSQSEICRQNPKILGYKIQLVVVKSNEEANQVKAYFRNRFPTIKTEVDASLRPNYKVLAGSYLTKESAAPDLKKIKQYFNSAVPVQYRVFCVEAK